MAAVLKMFSLLLVAMVTAEGALPPMAINIGQLMKEIQMPGIVITDKLSYKPHKLRMLKWRVTDCGMPSDPLKVNGTLMPDPLNINDQITGSFNVTTMVTIDKPLRGEVEIKKKVLGQWAKIPCVDNIGSCTYDDLCSLIPLEPGDPCPSPLSDYNIPCECPFKIGSYVLPPQTFYLTVGLLPEWLVTGEYQARAKLSFSGKALACREVAISVVEN